MQISKTGFLSPLTRAGGCFWGCPGAPLRGLSLGLCCCCAPPQHRAAPPKKPPSSPSPSLGAPCLCRFTLCPQAATSHLVSSSIDLPPRRSQWSSSWGVEGARRRPPCPGRAPAPAQPPRNTALDTHAGEGALEDKQCSLSAVSECQADFLIIEISHRRHGVRSFIF